MREDERMRSSSLARRSRSASLAAGGEVRRENKHREKKKGVSNTKWRPVGRPYFGGCLT